MLAIPVFQARTQTALFRANNKPPLEVVVANFDAELGIIKRRETIEQNQSVSIAGGGKYVS